MGTWGENARRKRAGHGEEPGEAMGKNLESNAQAMGKNLESRSAV